LTFLKDMKKSWFLYFLLAKICFHFFWKKVELQ
jgi:hypothetical protein